MAMPLSPSAGPHAEPNVTSRIDVLLVLLIIFMVIVPVTPRGMATPVPQPAKAGESIPYYPIILEIAATTAGPAYRINGHPIERNSRLSAVLTQIYAIRASKVLFVKADPALSFATVAHAIDLSRAAGVRQVAIVTPGIR